MLVVSAGSGNYPFHLTMRYCENKCYEYGYIYHPFDLGGLGFGLKMNDPRCESKFRRVKSAMKPELIEMMFDLGEETIVWIDGDATLIQSIPEIEADDSFDIGITVREKVNKKKSHYINAGVVFVKNNARARKFVDFWIASMPPLPDLDTMEKPSNYSDQQTLEEKILLPALDCPLWDLVGEIHEVMGVRVKFFDCETYNNFALIKAPRWEEGPGDTKILHFKGHRMHRIESYHERFLSER